jgi:hypothetical protein
MTQTDLTGAIAELEAGGRTATFIDADCPDLSVVPAPWRGIARSDDAEERRLLALSLWNREFLDLIPGYAGALASQLADVQACVLSDEGPVLIYLFETSARAIDFWIGWDPATFGDKDPVFWETIPAPARTFLRGVHAGYTGSDWECCGIMRPKDMTTFADSWGSPDGIPGWSDNWWPDCQPIDSRRMLYITRTSDTYQLSTSPDLPPGEALVSYDGEVNVVDFGQELDKIMLIGL